MRETWVYIVTNTHNTVVYSGSTSNLDERIAQHRDGAGSDFAAKYNCWKLVWCECFPDFEEAYAFERKLKRWKREWKDALVEEDNLGWDEIVLN